MIRLETETIALWLAPEMGGSVVRFRYRGQDVFRDGTGARTVLETSSFPLVPFAGRIADSRFNWRGKPVALTPVFPGDPASRHAIHGHGWLSAWAVTSADAASAEIVLDHAADDWPWTYRATQRFALTDHGFTLRMSVTNQGAEPMPAGMGPHPYFPRNDRTMLRALHRSEWQTDGAGLPLRPQAHARAIDWWNGAPVESRLVDTAYGDREGDIEIIWPDRQLYLTIRPSDELPHTVVYVPPGADFFCVEPISHVPNALNAPDPAALGIRTLELGETWSAAIGFEVREQQPSPVESH
jgi:aldose 1-epimerase